jgi:hypothetical protein
LSCRITPKPEDVDLPREVETLQGPQSPQELPFRWKICFDHIFPFFRNGKHRPIEAGECQGNPLMTKDPIMDLQTALTFRHSTVQQDIVCAVDAISDLCQTLDRLGVATAMLVRGPTILRSADVVQRVQQALGNRGVGLFARCPFRKSYASTFWRR